MSLEQILVKFDQSIRLAAPSSKTPLRVESIVQMLHSIVSKYIVRGLAQQHRTLFMMQLSMRVMGLPRQTRSVLVLGGSSVMSAQSPFGWLDSTAWSGCSALGSLASFRSVVDDVRSNEAGWKAWYELENPEAHSPPILSECVL